MWFGTSFFISYCMLSSHVLIFFFKINFFKSFVQKHTHNVKCLDPAKDWHSVGPDLAPDCLQRLLADNKSRCYQRKSYYVQAMVALVRLCIHAGLS